MYTSRSSKKERYFYSNYLIGVVKGLEGLYTTIDLRNESCITGKIIHVDGFMNIELEDVIFYDQNGLEHIFETMFITARLIRYVHIPKEEDVAQITKEIIAGLRISRKSKQKPTFKQKRAELQQKETVASITNVRDTCDDSKAVQEA